MTTFDRVTDDGGIEAVATLAHEIWNQHFVPLIGQAQVDYMLDKFLTPSAIRAQLPLGYEYYLVDVDGESIGFLALVPDPDGAGAHLSKLYVRVGQRGRGVGRAAIVFVEKLCMEWGVGTLWLRVNVGNAGPIAFYKRMGFRIADALVADIGGGFVMDDYRMEKAIPQALRRA